jgi:nicotinamide-nucleotide amidase
MRAEILAVGTELLLGQINDTNASAIAQKLAEAGVDVLYAAKVGDNHARIVACLRDALERADAVVVTGGLGPTQDDITREAIAEVMGVELRRVDAIGDMIRRRFEERGRYMAENNLRQADVPEGATVIPAVGTAPGLICPVGTDHVIYAMPGVPWEMQHMLDSAVVPDLLRRSGGNRVIRSRVLRTWGVSESRLAEMLADQFEALEATGNPTMAFLAGGGEIRIRLTAAAPTEEAALAVLAEEEARVRDILGGAIFGADDETMAVVVGQLLVAAGQRVAVVESCTGGVLSEKLTEAEGASDWFAGGLVCYTPDTKVKVLGCDPLLVDGDRVVSEETAVALARGARDLFGVDWGVSVTGEAGPLPATGHPVGTVCVGWTGPGGEGALTTRLPGDRRRIQEFAAAAAINMLRLTLLGEEPRAPFR